MTLNVRLITEMEMPGKAISGRYGYDGRESRDIILRGRRLQAREDRLAIMIHGEYPAEIAPFVYFNRALLGLVQDAFGNAGLLIGYAPDTAQPPQRCSILQTRCALEFNLEYNVMNDKHEEVGSLTMWGPMCGWGGEFYGEENYVIDVILPRNVSDSLLAQLHAICSKNDVEFRLAPEGPARPKSTFLERCAAKLLGKR